MWPVSSGFSRLAGILGPAAGNAEVGARMAVDSMENWWWSRQSKSERGGFWLGLRSWAFSFGFFLASSDSASANWPRYRHRGAARETGSLAVCLGVQGGPASGGWMRCVDCLTLETRSWLRLSRKSEGD